MEIFYGKAKDGKLIFGNQKEAREYFLSVNNKPLTVRIARDTGSTVFPRLSTLPRYTNRFP